MEIISKTEKSTKDAGTLLAKDLDGKNVLCLFGELGSGKTVFTKGIAEGLGIKKRILSPTFVIIREYQIPKSEKILYHIDLYRLETEKEVINAGIVSLFEDKNNIVVLEWAEKLGNLLPSARIEVKFKVTDDERTIQIDRY